MCDVISRELMMIDHRNRYMLLIIISLQQLHTSLICYGCIININCDFTHIFSRTFVKQNPSICKWNVARDDDKLKYSHRTNN